MRLKVMEKPLSIYNNGNNHNNNNNNNNTNILNSPKRLNTIQNCNVTSNHYNNKHLNLTTSTIKTNKYTEKDAIIKELAKNYNNINKNQTSDTVQWCNRIDVVNGRQLQNDNTTTTTTRREQLYNINNTTTLAVTLKDKRCGTVPSSICFESSSDDSFLDYEDSRQSCASSIVTTPQDEERTFDDVLDGELYITDDGNTQEELITDEHRGIINPNYPGFQHLAHTLDYTIKVTSSSSTTSTSSTSTSSDTELSEDEVIDAIAIDNDNNNNINDEEEDEDCRMLDQIDNVNRLDSFENVQKVFYDKPVFNLTLENETEEVEEQEELVDTNSTDGIKIDINNLSKIDLNLKEDLEESVDKLTITKDLKTPSSSTTTTTTTSGYNIVQTSNMTATVATVHTNEMFPLNVKEIPSSYDDDIDKTYVSDSINLTLDTTFFKETIYDKICEKFCENLNKDSDGSDVMMLDDDGTCYKVKFSDAFLSGIHDTVEDLKDKLETNKIVDNDTKCSIGPVEEKYEKFCKEDITKEINEKDEDGSMVPRKKEKIDTNRMNKKRRDFNQQNGCNMTIQRRDNNRNHHHKHHHHHYHHHHHHRDNLNRRSLPINGQCDLNNESPEIMETFDVYNIETAMPKIDLDAIECHLRAAREEERRRRTDREEIRRRLAMGNEEDYYNNCDRPGRKPSLQARLQSGMNLQICFMNETASDTESPSSDSECPMTNPKQLKSTPKINNDEKQTEKLANIIPTRPATLSIGQPLLQPLSQPLSDSDFFAKQAKLQTEARMALAQAKEMARMQMEIERQRQKKSPITEMVRNSLEKVGIQFPEDRRRLSRQILTEMNVAQLQVIVNDLHTQIETLNEKLVKYLMDRDDLHMEQDSMLVDIEDLTRYLGAKEQIKEKNVTQNNNVAPPSPAPSSPLAAALNSTVKPHLSRIASLVKK